MANLELVAVRIFEKNGVITGAIFHAQFRAFDVLRAGFAKNFGNVIDRFATRRPERNSICVRLMIGFLFESKEINADSALRFEQTPALTALVDAKSDRRQNQFIKSLGRLAISYPQVDVIEKARAHGKSLGSQMWVVYLRFSRRIMSFSPDHVSSTAHTFTSTKPSGKATSRITSSVMSVRTFAAFFGHETHTTPVSCTVDRSRRRWFASADRDVLNTCTNAGDRGARVVT